jgi:hypothetical protein
VGRVMTCRGEERAAQVGGASAQDRGVSEWCRVSARRKEDRVRMRIRNGGS